MRLTVSGHKFCIKLGIKMSTNAVATITNAVQNIPNSSISLAIFLYYLTDKNSNYMKLGNI